MSATADPISILLVGDNPGDVRLTQEALHEAEVPHHLRVAHDGDEALRFLWRPVPRSTEPRIGLKRSFATPRNESW